MPIYQCVTSKVLSAELKAAIAKEFTRIHVEFTAAPEPFVNIVFSDLPLGSHYLAGAVRENGTLINAIVRAGRTGDAPGLVEIALGRLGAPHRPAGA